MKCIAECKDKDVLRGKVAGILELITGFFSLYLGFISGCLLFFSRKGIENEES